jgi:uncharacterized protein (DUF934 family)
MQSVTPRSTRVLTQQGTFVDSAWPDGSHGLVPLDEFLARPGVNHPLLIATDDVAKLAPHLSTLQLIEVRLEKLGDGRGYSIAALLRRNGYRGDLRAVGDVLIDQLHMLRRVGFSTFALRADQPEDLARFALNRYSDAYQAAYDQPLPAFRRAPRAASLS